ncbi:hypothetical protein C9374_000226 [Naegleria lovaniensis]|uniref:Uncharacterized protein n=1 Tax=Naegleria lovaniensis TaxID=51637 RepID=A0AA88GXA8_NAELO|nr:uncharacterized protein C9374_000226 [Naegleria lovaniensis]KAG2388787.1 hypothetical protein C9374_000226 [Naegleria lovaniensis]
MFSKRKQQNPFRRIAQTKDSPVDSKKLKKLLIVRGQEPDHFFKCICEKFNGFVKNPELLNWRTRVFSPYEPDDSFAFLCSVDVLDQAELTPEHVERFRFHFDYDFVVFPMYAGFNISSEVIKSVFNEIMSIMKDLISSKRVAILFLRGSNAYSVPSRLGYISNNLESGFADCTSQPMMEIDVSRLNEICMNSSILLEFKTKHLELFSQHVKQKSVDLSQTYKWGLPVENCIYLSQWNILATAEERKKICMLIHKTERVMFTPWYGFSHGNQLCHDLVRYFCKYLVLEYLIGDDTVFKTKLSQKYQNFQLCDIVVTSAQE